MARWLKLSAAPSGDEIWLNLDNAVALTPNKSGKGTKVSFSMTKDSVPVEIKETVAQIQDIARKGG